MREKWLRRKHISSRQRFHRLGESRRKKITFLKLSLSLSRFRFPFRLRVLNAECGEKFSVLDANQHFD